MSYLESLPTNVYTHILDQLNQVTGSRGIINKADIPVAARYVRHLACTCKAIAEKVNSADAIQMLLNSLSDKYQLRYSHLSALLNTKGAKEWMWKHIEKNGYVQVYETIQAILDHTDMTNSEKANIALTTGMPLTTGYILTVFQSMLTPLGIIKLDSKALIPKLNTQLVPEFLGYQIMNLNGEKLPEAEFIPWGSQLSLESIQMIWQMIKYSKDPLATSVTLTTQMLAKEALFKNINEVSGWAIKYMKELVDQRSLPKKLKLDPSHAATLKQLNYAAEKSLGERILTLAYDKEDEVQLRDLISCNLNELQKTYDSIVHHISQSWIQAELKDYPDQSKTESEEDYFLFIKNDLIFGESSLLESLVNQLDVSNSITLVSNTWKGSSKLSLWIKKDDLDKVFKAFNITLS